MFSIPKMLKKGLVAFVAFLGPTVLSILLKLVPSLSSTTVGDFVNGLLDKLIPGLPSISLAAGIMMLINFLKNRPK